MINSSTIFLFLHWRNCRLFFIYPDSKKISMEVINDINLKGLRIMNRNVMKYLVIILMVLDHISFFMPQDNPLVFIFQFTSRLTAIIMCFFIAEGYYYTRSVKSYMKRLFIFALISYPAYIFAFTGTLIPIAITQGHIVPEYAIVLNGYLPQTAYSVYLSLFNVTFSILENSIIFTLFLGLVSIYVWDHLEIPTWLKALITIGFLYISSFSDYRYFAILYCLIFYFFRDNPTQKWISFSIISILYIFNICLSNPFTLTWTCEFMAFRIGVFLTPFLLLLYNGEPGKKSAFHKWFFYIFYPGHLFLLGLIGCLIGAFT